MPGAPSENAFWEGLWHCVSLPWTKSPTYTTDIGLADIYNDAQEPYSIDLLRYDLL